ncbi:uncharacterized protein BYT42DRAFT_574799 [Radiomyces spectabilis]|uniref:uncharacterized protein n=1 Tax=Radiomyces spectabilis TaxID=64574 RepID=UPI00221FB145|nr:uncharacterized protein BYT42DRAFT_574799 [Radiomyces spectabilis]KAI8376489.1 hypothetical protein BYT42DRAFT_574799 [Radiomyces spectabilis]
MPQILCAPINEESDISSTGPSSTETGYNTSSNYVTITQSSSRRPYMNGIYGHGEDDFLHHYQYQPTLQSSFQPNLTFQQYSDNASPATMPSSHQPSLFYHHSTYMGYPSSSYPNSYYPNVLGIAPCNSETTTAAGASTVNAPEPGTITERGTRNDSHPTTAESFLRSANNGTDILAHHPEQQHYFGPSSTQFVPYASSNMTESPFATTDLR